jgi:hypothetical protein
MKNAFDAWNGRRLRKEGEDGSCYTDAQEQVMTRSGIKKATGNGTKENGAKRLTFKQIEKLHDSEWVLLGDLDMDKYLDIKHATVLAHSPSKDRVFRQAMKLNPKRFAFFYIGDDVVPKGMGAVL